MTVSPMKWLAALALAAIASSAAAHPHAWIDVRSTVVLDGDRRIVAIEQEWLFDEFYTLFATDGLKRSGAKQAAALRELAAENLRNLEPYGYFVEVRADGTKVRAGTVEAFDTEVRHGRLWLRFEVPLDAPIDPARQQFTFAVFDPTYYIEMLHLPDDLVAFRGAGANDCQARIEPPNPPTEAVMLAAALDRNAAADDTLGALFAEQVSVECR